MNAFGVLFFPGVLLLVMAPVLGFLFFLRFRESRQSRRPPFTKDFLRSPGESLQEQVNLLQDKFVDVFLVMVIAPLSMLYIWLILGLKGALLFSLANASIVGYVMWKIYRLFGEKRIAQLGFEGERAVGEELNLLMLKGMRVFHDLQKEKPKKGIARNIDHVVVGPNGVFVVETKARSKGPRAGSNATTILFDGETITFPDGYTTQEPLNQARQHAAWLSKQLTSATGEAVRVKPVVVYPGWFVSQTKPVRDVFVLAGGQVVKAFPTLQGEKLSAEKMQRIVHQLDQQCRKVEPWRLGRKS